MVAEVEMGTGAFACAGGAGNFITGRGAFTAGTGGLTIGPEGFATGVAGLAAGVAFGVGFRNKTGGFIITAGVGFIGCSSIGNPGCISEEV